MMGKGLGCLAQGERPHLSDFRKTARSSGFTGQTGARFGGQYGLQVYGACQWLAEKNGARFRNGWRKLHLALDADNGEIIAHTLTNQEIGDVSHVEPLLDHIGDPIGQFSADGAYDGRPAYHEVNDHSAAAAIVIRLSRMATVHPASRLDELLPWQWKAAQPPKN